MALPLNLQNYTATISAGSALSAPVSVGAGLLVGILIPPAWTAASLTFQTSVDGVNWYDVYDELTNELTVQVPSASGAYILFDPDTWLGVNMFKIRSGTTAVPVNQASSAAITLVTRAQEY
jgi:hypothetical protein